MTSFQVPVKSEGIQFTFKCLMTALDVYLCTPNNLVKGTGHIWKTILIELPPLKVYPFP